MGITVSFVSLLILLPLATLPIVASGQGAARMIEVLTAERTLSAYGLSVGAALIAALINTVFGVVIAWVLVRYRFPGRQLIDGLIDLPFALPTAVAGIALTAVYAKTGWIGQLLEPLHIQAAYSRLGIVIAMILVSIPFVVRTVQPVLEELDPEIEDAAASLGASRWTTFRRVILPALAPAVLTGMALAFAKGIGEYGSVIFISSNLPNQTEIAPLLIVNRLEEYDYPAAATVALGLLIISFVLLLLINLLQSWLRRESQR